MTWLSSRVSTYQMSYFMRSNVAETTSQLQRASAELASGRRADIFADLGSRSAVAITMRAREDDTQAYLDSNKILENKLQAMLDGMDTMRNPIDDLKVAVVLNKEKPTAAVSALQTQARAALETLFGTLNTRFNGEFLFAGTESQTQPMTPWETPDADTGLSPKDVIDAIVGAGPTDVASVTAISAELDQVMSSTHANANYNFEASFFNGTPNLDASSQPNQRVTGRLDQGQELHYGVQANDQAFRDTVKGLVMLASVEVDQITDPDAYKAWMEEAFQSLAKGSDGLLDITAEVGFNQQLVEQSKERLTDLSIVQTKQIGEYENIDPYEVATRLQGLQTQLQASYSITARISELTILNFYR